MKATTALLKELEIFATEIAKIGDELQKNGNDSERAEAAVRQAEDLDEQINALHQRRAEHRARAFVERSQANMTELDKQLAELERASRQAVEDGAAARIALDMLAAQRAELEVSLAATRERRTQVVLEFLGAQRDEAIAAYIDRLAGLGEPLAKAAACDVVRRLVAPGDRGESLGVHMLQEARANSFAIPRSLFVDGWAPIPWLRSHYLTGKEQYHGHAVALAEQLRAAGLPIDPEHIRSKEPMSVSARLAVAEMSNHYL